MRPIDYLRERGESEPVFARRAGIHQRSFHRAIRGNCTLRLARKIVQASREAPTPTGGTITFEDLACEPKPAAVHEPDGASAA